jgi:hypothetical protein
MTQKRTLLTTTSLARLTSVQQSPCLSLYQPTHRHHPENAQDPIRFRNLVKELETSLRQRWSADETRRLGDSSRSGRRRIQVHAADHNFQPDEIVRERHYFSR